jgi:hypothetical protein
MSLFTITSFLAFDSLLLLPLRLPFDTLLDRIERDNPTSPFPYNILPVSTSHFAVLPEKKKLRYAILLRTAISYNKAPSVVVKTRHSISRSPHGSYSHVDAGSTSGINRIVVNPFRLACWTGLGSNPGSSHLATLRKPQFCGLRDYAKARWWRNDSW